MTKVSQPFAEEVITSTTPLSRSASPLTLPPPAIKPPPSTRTCNIMPRHVEVAIIGAGPQALTVAAHLLEPEPFSHWDPEDKAFTMRIRQKGRHFNHRVGMAAVSCVSQLAVIDESGEWLSAWRGSFEFFDIPHLRSPMLAHPDPRSQFRLLELSRQHELTNVSVVDGMLEVEDWNAKTRGKSGVSAFNAATSHLFERPPSSAFQSLCDEVIDRYDLRRAVTKARVLSIQPRASDAASKDQTGVVLRLSDGSVLSADRVVCCVGMGSPRIPSWALSHRLPLLDPPHINGATTHTSDVVFAARSKTTEIGPSPPLPSRDRRLPATLPVSQGTPLKKDNAPTPLHEPTATTQPHPFSPAPAALKNAKADATPTGTATSTSPQKPLPPLPILHSSELLRMKMGPASLFQHRRVVVVGGGLTAAHLVLLAHKHGCRDVTMLSRATLRVQQFCVPLHWVGRNRYKTLSDFRQTPIQQRAEVIAQSRPGGSLTPIIMQRIRAIMADKVQARKKKGGNGSKRVKGDGRMAIREGWQVTGIGRAAEGQWWVEVEGQGRKEVMEQVDCIILATGVETDVCQDPLLGPLLSQHQPTACGLPDLDGTLSLQGPGSSEGPLAAVHVLGAYAALQLGPDAANLSGAVKGARIIADFIRAERHYSQLGTEEEGESWDEVIGSVHELNNPFDLLMDDSDDDEDED